MPLKSLELIGYKTFASKTTFEFSDSITAIVGPNGSGKSNIADALRWVLGEQSYSLLRGKKTVDMIFSGSEHRPRAGMASVTVTFDNSGGWLPIDFSEVAITRRAYRDGQNEYLINGQKVRLRDVTDLLGHSGLAERTYTIIGQGLVDAALSLKAEERRKLFEEAAGIGVYRTRREDALRRLETTRRNLERVNDILAELRPRLTSLERQARRAREYDQVNADLQALLREWYGYHWHRQQKDLTSAREIARSQEAILASARTRQLAFDQEINSLRDRIHILRGKLNAWHRETAGLHNRRERLSREIAVTQERQRSLDERRLGMRSEQTRLREELRLQEERFARAADEVEQQQQAVSEAQAQAASSSAALAARLAERAEREQSLQQLEQRRAQTASTTAAQQARLEELRGRIRALESAQADLEKNVISAEAEATAAEARVDQAGLSARQASEARRQAEEAVTVRSAAVRALEEKKNELRDLQQKQQTELAKLDAQLEVLRQAEQALAGYSAGARVLLQAGKAGQLDGVGAALSSRLEVPAEFETAVAAALGQSLDAVLLDSGERSLEQALDLLAASQANGALLPLDAIGGGSLAAALRAPGVIGNLATLVRCPLEIRPLVDVLLGQVILVQDRKTAQALRRAVPAGVRLVNVQGEIFTPEGQVFAGGHGTAGLIARSRQQREIEAQVKQKREQLGQLAGMVEEHTAALQAAKSALQAHQDALQAARRTEEAMQSAARSAESQREQLISQANWHRTQRTAQRHELGQAAETLTAAELSLEQTRHQYETMRAEAQALRRELLELPTDEFQSQENHWRTRLAVAERAAQDAVARVEDRRQALAEVSTRLQELDRQLVEVEAEQAALAAEQETLRSEESELAQQIASARTLIEPAEAELQDLEAQQDSIQKTEAEARLALTTAERNHAQAQITLARRQEALDSLRQRIEDDFGLVAFEYVEEVSGPNPLPLGSLVENLPLVQQLSADLDETIKRLRTQLRRMGAINPEAQKEHIEVKERFEFMTVQVEDLVQAEKDILETVSELDVLMEREFRTTFDQVAREFRETFTRLFGGGSARLVLTNPDDMTNTGVDIEARLPGRRSQGLSLLSGGERSLTAAALVFSLIRVSPTPFCVLDEVDAMLDEANVNRLADLLRELSAKTQFIVITHNRNTVQAAETIYGITMGRDSTSQMLGLKMDQMADLVNGERT